jgi:hypothetical protein
MMCQLIGFKRTRSGTQVVRINAELLHFHSTVLAYESSMGGVDLMGAKSAAHASVRAATVSKGRFIAILLSSSVCKWALFLIRPPIDQQVIRRWFQALFSDREKWLRPLPELFRGHLGTKPLHGIASEMLRSQPSQALVSRDPSRQPAALLPPDISNAGFASACSPLLSPLFRVFSRLT